MSSGKSKEKFNFPCFFEKEIQLAQPIKSVIRSEISVVKCKIAKKPAVIKGRG